MIAAVARTARSPHRQYRRPANALQTFRKSSGSLAMSAALRRASSLVSSLGQFPSDAVDHDEHRVNIFDRPRRRQGLADLRRGEAVPRANLRAGPGWGASLCICEVASGRLAECCCSMLMKARLVAPVAVSMASSASSTMIFSIKLSFPESNPGAASRAWGGNAISDCGHRQGLRRNATKEKRFSKLCVGRLAARCPKAAATVASK